MHLTILGSGELIRSLQPHGLIDEYLLMIHPLVVGRGVRLFGEEPADLELVDSVTTTTGVIIATYRSREVISRRDRLASTSPTRSAAAATTAVRSAGVMMSRPGVSLAFMAPSSTDIMAHRPR